MITTSVDLQLPALLNNPLLTYRAIQSFFREARTILAQEHEHYFATSTAPDGTPWQPLSQRTLHSSIRKALQSVGVRGRYTIRRQRGTVSTVYQGNRAVARIRRSSTGALTVRAIQPVTGFQRTARVRRTARSKILVDTARLRNSVVSIAANADAIRQQQRLTLIWGTNVPYARAHQYGDPTRNLPARPFLGVSARGQQELATALTNALNRYVQTRTAR